jgi:thiamine-monophosphate kinase
VARGGRGRQLAAADGLVESIHFRRDEPPFLLGRKALAVNLSDIAAMGGRPRRFLLTLAIPSDLTPAYLDALVAGLADAAAEAGVLLAGGDTCASPGPLMISITVLGELPGAEAPLTRSGARAGDGLYVSGPLGVSATGRALLEAGWRPAMARRGRTIDRAVPPGEATLTQRTRAREALRAHLDPRPRLDLGRHLRARRLASAAMDLSDGLAMDLRRLTDASGTGARVIGPAVPIGDAPRALAALLGREPIDLALHGGEDYELLIAVPPHREARLERLGLLFVGRLTPRRTGLVIADGVGGVSRLRPAGFDHFNRPPTGRGRGAPSPAML